MNNKKSDCEKFDEIENEILQYARELIVKEIEFCFSHADVCPTKKHTILALETSLGLPVGSLEIDIKTIKKFLKRVDQFVDHLKTLQPKSKGKGPKK